MISLQYNFLGGYFEEEKRSGMLDILRQFFHYCNENKGIPKLSSFYKEFIAEYYKNNKEEYGKIYEFCSTLLKNTESYCKIYQHICTHYINHLSTIKNIKQEEIDEGTEALQWLISEYSSAAIILQLGKDNNVLSNITPILVGTVPGGFLILFFLYKVYNKSIYHIYI